MKRLGLVGAGGTAAAIVGLIVSSCCALPMALAFMGVSTSLIGLLEPLHALRPAILAVAALLAVAWFMAIRRRSTGAYVALTMATGLYFLSFLWRAWDPLLQGVVQNFARP